MALEGGCRPFFKPSPCLPEGIFGRAGMTERTGTNKADDKINCKKDGKGNRAAGDRLTETA